jgi:hypothetical protein
MAGTTKRDVDTMAIRWPRTRGVLLGTHASYFRLLTIANDKRLKWLRRQLYQYGMASLIMYRNRDDVRSLLTSILSYVHGRGSVLGVESLMLSCLQSLSRDRDRHLWGAALATIRDVQARQLSDVSEVPLSIYERSTGLLTIVNPKSWNVVADRMLQLATGLVRHRHRRNGTWR